MPAPDLGDKRVETYSLANGLQVLLRPIEGARETALIVVYSIGCDHDPEGQSGLGHMVEHLYVTAAAGNRKAVTAEEFVSRHPHGANGQTGDRYTVLATVFPPTDLEKEIEEAADRMGKLRIDAGDLGRELPRLRVELANMFGDMPALGARNLARELIRPTPRGGRRGGQIADLEQLSVEQVQRHWTRFYKPRNALLSIAGEVDTARARGLIARSFEGLPAGEPPPPPGEPGPPRFGVVRQMTSRPIDPDATPAACLAYAAPPPGSERYATFLACVAGLWTESAKLENAQIGSPVDYAPLDDGVVLTVSAEIKPGEGPQQAIARLERIVAEALQPKFSDNKRRDARDQFGFLFGLVDVPDQALAQNPYGAAFTRARWRQLSLDAARLGRDLEVLTETEFRRAATEFFAPTRHAAACVLIER
jgi:zinc protease